MSLQLIVKGANPGPLDKRVIEYVASPDRAGILGRKATTSDIERCNKAPTASSNQCSCRELCSSHQCVHVERLQGAARMQVTYLEIEPVLAFASILVF